MEPIEAVIFDWGGVLIDNPAQELGQYCAQALRADVQDYVRAHSRHGDAFQKGQIPEATFWQRVCAELDRPVPQIASLWGEALRAVHAPREAVFQLVRRLRNAGIKVAILSNTEAPAIELSREPRYRVFDVVVLSCAAGIAKPAPEIYRTAAAELQTAPQRCAFIDDRQDFVDGAAAVGMKAILYRSLEQVEGKLEDLGLPVREAR